MPTFRGWTLAPEGPAGTEVQVQEGGHRAFILRGARFLEHGDGSIDQAREVFHEEDVKAIPLPERLGGGFLFYVTAGSGTSMWRAASWTGDLRPLGRIEPPVSSVTPGFDRLYLSSATSHVLRALDPATGKAVDLSPVPPASAYGGMVFADAWHAVVLAGVRGALATFDAGESWFSIGKPDAVSGAALGPGGSIVLTTETGRFELDSSGKLAPTGPSGSDALFRGTDTFARYSRDAFPPPSEPDPVPVPLGPRPLRAAVLRGAADTADSAVVIERGVFGRVRLSDGKVLSSEPYSGREPCRGVALGLGVGFVCGDAHGPMEIYAYRNGRLELELELDPPRRVVSSGNGALIMAGACSSVRRAGSAPSAPARRRASGDDASIADYCVRQVSGELEDVRVRGDVGSERIAALRDGRVAIVIPPRPGSKGRLSIIGSAGTVVRELELSPDTGAASRLVRSGLWLEELWEVEEGRLGGWVVGARAFAGVHVDLEGVVRPSRVFEGVDETSFSGAYALSVAASATARETTNHGFDWRVSELPPALLAPASGAVSRRPVRGCSSVGCVYGDWVRVGFSDEEQATEPARPESPARVTYPSPGFAYWTLTCEAGGRTRPERPPARAATGGSKNVSRSANAPAIPESSAWLSFQGAAPPAYGAGDAGYDFGDTSEHGAYRAYAWGPSSADWTRHGKWQLRVGDRFSRAAPWSTQITRSPWSDAAAAALAFGLDPSTGVDWWLRLGASGDSGVLQVRARSETSLHLVARGRSAQTLLAGADRDLGTVAGAHQIGDEWFLGATRAEDFHLYRVEHGRLHLVATYPLWGRIVTQLVQSVHGDELALWQKAAGAGWYVIPLDPVSFEPGPARFISVERLGRVPPRCEAEQPGWLAVAGVPLTESAVSESNTHLDFTGIELRTKRLTARVVAHDGGVCVDALAALSEGAFPREPARGGTGATARGLPLTVTDPTTDERWTFRCTP